ncbi:MAG: nitrate reductase [Verrucomicrobiota bacterium]
MNAKRFIEGKFRAFDGPLTEQLLREPGKFGLGQLPRSLDPDATTSMICGFCSTGCSLNVHLRDGQAINLSPDPDYPVNLGMACPKGWESLTPLAADDRATRPLVRSSSGQPLQATDWKSAATVFCERMRQVQQEHGPESAAFLSTGQICTEEMALLGAFAKFEMGMIHGDGNTRQCMATAVTAYKESFGFDAPPYTYQDFEDSDVIVLIGSNLCIAHPILWQRVLRNRNGPEIIVVDPRKTETAMQATQHVALSPKSDLTLLYGIAQLLIQNNWLDQDYIEAHTSGFAAFKKHVASFTAERVSEICDVSVSELTQVARKIGEGKRVSLWWTMGVNQSYEATRTAQAIINIALMTGNIGRPGTGANSITGQCNAMGSRLFSNTTNLLGGHDFLNPEHRHKVAEILEMDVGKIPDQRSWAYDQIVDGIESGKIRALWMIATNGAHSWVQQNRFRDLLSKLDFFVVQDIYPTTETAALADLFLPAAGWGEKDGTLINSERRIGLVKRVSQSPGEALADFSIFRYLATTWGAGSWLEKWKTPEDAFQILKQLSADQPCDIRGIGGYREIDESGGIQWPLPKKTASIETHRQLFTNGRFYTEDGRARFVFDDPRSNPEMPDEEYPLCLLTGRGSSAQWHTESRTGKSEILKKLRPKESYAEINPEDAEALGILNGDRITVRSRRGKLSLSAMVTATVKPGQIFIPMHDPRVNRLTLSSFDPISRQPNYKACAVNVERI